jgi:hypothetical protein
MHGSLRYTVLPAPVLPPLGSPQVGRRTPPNVVRTATKGEPRSGPPRPVIPADSGHRTARLNRPAGVASPVRTYSCHSPPLLRLLSSSPVRPSPRTGRGGPRAGVRANREALTPAQRGPATTSAGSLPPTLCHSPDGASTPCTVTSRGHYSVTVLPTPCHSPDGASTPCTVTSGGHHSVTVLPTPVLPRLGERGRPSTRCTGDDQSLAGGPSTPRSRARTRPRTATTSEEAGARHEFPPRAKDDSTPGATLSKYAPCSVCCACTCTPSGPLSSFLGL